MRPVLTKTEKQQRKIEEVAKKINKLEEIKAARQALYDEEMLDADEDDVGKRVTISAKKHERLMKAYLDSQRSNI